jgi:hypothetical protein
MTPANKNIFELGIKYKSIGYKTESTGGKHRMKNGKRKGVTN